jgi:putative ABC transport system permease protein
MSLGAEGEGGDGRSVRRDAGDGDVDREIAGHIELRAAELEAEGWKPDRAREEAERLFGDKEEIARACRAIARSQQRAVRRGMMADAFWQDLRYGVRTLLRSPGFALVAILTLALGIGANTAIFSVVRGVLLRPLPFGQPDRLVTVAELSNKGRPMSVAWPNFTDWRSESSSFAGLTVADPFPTTVLGGERPVKAEAAAVGQDFWKVFPVRPVEGRLTVPADHAEGAAPVAVVSRSFWRNQLGGKPLGDYDLEVDGSHVRVVGVVPDGFDYPVGAQIWTPAEPQQHSDSRSAHNWKVVGRLAPGVSLDRARQEVDALTKRIVSGLSGEDPDFIATGAVVTPLLESMVGNTRRPLYLLLAAAFFVLLVACTNLASTLLARGASRERELAVRTAIGAGRSRIVRQLLTESLLLAGIGAIGGVAVGIGVVHAVVAAGPAFLPRLSSVAVDGQVLAFTAAVAVVTALLFGILPARRMTRGAEADALRAGSRGNALDGRGGVWRFLVGVEVALALVLLAGSGLLVRSFRTLLAENPGFDAHDVDVMPMSLSQIKYPTAADHGRFYGQFLEQVKAIPGVADAGVMSTVPGEGAPNGRLELDGSVDKHAVGEYVALSTGAFKALNIRLLEGRFFDERDGPNDEHVAIVSKSFADRYWPGEDAVGKSVTGGGMDSFWQERRFARVVGVVADARLDGLDQAPYPTVYFPYTQRPSRMRYSAYVVAEATDGNPAALTGALRATLRAADPDVPVEISTLTDDLRDSLAPRRFVMVVLAGFSLTALLLAGVGIFGVVSYTVARRTREMGIRVALGAHPRSVRGMMVAHAMRMVGAGLVLGLAAAVALGRVMRSLLYDVSPTDPVAIAGAALLLAAVALVASWVPARSGTRVDPTITMRAE